MIVLPLINIESIIKGVARTLCLVASFVLWNNMCRTNDACPAAPHSDVTDASLKELFMEHEVINKYQS